MLKTWLVCSLLHCNYENRPRTPRPPWTLFTTHSYQTHQGWALEYEKRAHYKNVENVIPRKKFGQPNFYLWLYLQVYSGRISWINFYTSRTKVGGQWPCYYTIYGIIAVIIPYMVVNGQIIALNNRLVTVRKLFICEVQSPIFLHKIP